MKKSELLNKNNRRIWELDFLRGLCVLLMVWDHFMYDCSSLFVEAWLKADNEGLIKLSEFATEYWNGNLREIFHPVIYNMFFVICGISCSFSRNNLARGIEALLLAFGITVVTSFLEVQITFGVLHMLGFAILIWWIINTVCRRNKFATAAVCLVVGIIIVCGDLVINSIGVEKNEDLMFLSYLFGGAYDSTDYFSLIPNVGVVLLGASVAPILYNKKRSLLPWFDKYGWYKPVGFFGKIALWVYVLHQVVVVVILSIVSYITIGDFVIIS